MEFSDTMIPNITVWPTWLRKEDLTDAQTGRKGSFVVMIDGEQVYIGNMLIPELDQGLPIPDTEHYKKQASQEICPPASRPLLDT